MPPPATLRVPFQDLPLQISHLRAELDAALAKVLDHGQFILGPEVTEFEQAWANFCGTSQCVGLGSGTDALHLILRALGIGAGDEVITVANTFIATAEAISYSGAKPVLVDCCLENYLIDPQAVAAAITPRTRAIIPVHLYGQPADLDQRSTEPLQSSLSIDRAQRQPVQDAVLGMLVSRGPQPVKRAHYARLAAVSQIDQARDSRVIP